MNGVEASMRPRTLISALGLLILAWGGYHLSRADDPTRIRWLFERQLEAFNDCSMSCIDGFHLDYVDRSADVDRDQLRTVLLYLFHREVDRKTGRFRYRAELPLDDFEITDLNADAGTASVRFRIRLFRALADQKLVWELQVDAELLRGDDDWKIHNSRHETLGGRRPGH